MSDYYTQACFVIPCNTEQAELAIKALDHLKGESKEYVELVIFKADSEISDALDKIIRHCVFNHPEYKEEPLETLMWELDAEVCDEGICVSPDESINTDHASVFTQAILVAFDLPHLVEITAARVCSCMEVDAFGGIAIVVSKDMYRWQDAREFLEAEREAHKEKARYFFCGITEENEASEYPRHFLLKCTGTECPEQKLDDIFTNLRGAGKKEGENFVWFSGGLSAKDPYMSEISPAEFMVMKNYLSVR